MMTYSTGGFHPAPDLKFENVLRVWDFVKGLRAVEILHDLVCCDEKGDILSAPHDNSHIPGIIEEKIAGSNEPRRWMLQN